MPSVLTGDVESLIWEAYNMQVGKEVWKNEFSSTRVDKVIRDKICRKIQVAKDNSRVFQHSCRLDHG